MAFLFSYDSSGSFYLKLSLGSFSFIPLHFCLLPLLPVGDDSIKVPCFGFLNLEKSFQAADLFPIMSELTTSLFKGTCPRL